MAGRVGAVRPAWGRAGRARSAAASPGPSAGRQGQSSNAHRAHSDADTTALAVSPHQRAPDPACPVPSTRIGRGHRRCAAKGTIMSAYLIDEGTTTWVFLGCPETSHTDCPTPASRSGSLRLWPRRHGPPGCRTTRTSRPVPLGVTGSSWTACSACRLPHYPWGRLATASAKVPTPQSAGALATRGRSRATARSRGRRLARARSPAAAATRRSPVQPAPAPVRADGRHLVCAAGCARDRHRTVRCTVGPTRPRRAATRADPPTESHTAGCPSPSSASTFRSCTEAASLRASRVQHLASAQTGSGRAVAEAPSPAKLHGAHAVDQALGTAARGGPLRRRRPDRHPEPPAPPSDLRYPAALARRTACSRVAAAG